jgi:predicted acetyltransferase
MPTPDDHVLRPLTPADLDAAGALGVEAFGAPPAGSPATPPPARPRPGRHAWGTFDAGGRLVAKVVGLELASWFGGVPVPTCGVAGVTVVAERRGDGLLGDLFRAVLGEARARGEVVSTLYPTAPGIYRRLGYELVGALDRVELPTAELLRVRAPAAGPGRVTTRRATPADAEAVRRVYDRWAAAQHGPLTRRGPLFPQTDEEPFADLTGLTLAVDGDSDGDGEVLGYAAWRRGEGYDETSTIEVDDLLATSADAYRALWRVIGSFSTVTGRVRLSTSGDDPARLLLPGGSWKVVGTHPYALRLLDVERAFGLRPPAGPPAGPSTGATELSFTVAGDTLGHLDGGYRLRVADGATACERGTADGPTFTPQGLALAWAGVQSCANLRMLGHLTGPASYDATLDALRGAGRVHVRDYF